MNRRQVYFAEGSGAHWVRRFFSGEFFKNLSMWTLLEFAVVPLPLFLLAMWSGKGGGEAYWNGLLLVLYLSGLGFLLGVSVVVLPCAIVSAWRFKFSSVRTLHFVPYLGTAVYAIVAVNLAGILVGLLLIPQIIAAPILHLLMARRFRKIMGDQ